MRNTGSGRLRYPQFRVLVNGIPIDAVSEARVESTNYYRPDHFTIYLAADLRSPSGLYSSCQAAPSVYTILARLSSHSDYTQLFVGRADVWRSDYTARTIRISGRDLSAVLQDTPSSDSFLNRTSSEIAVILANRHALIPVVTPTYTLAGRYYSDNVSQTSFNQFSRTATEWDQLTFLARCEGFDVYVDGHSLFFQPPASDVLISDIIRPDDLIDLKLQHRLQLSSEVAVTVRSWNSQDSSTVLQSAISRRIDDPYGTAVNGIQRYNLLKPNLTESEAATIASAKANEITRHEQCIEFVMPGELLLSSRGRFVLQGTQSTFDQIYEIDAVERTLSSTKGFVQTVRAHSISTRQIDIIAGSV
jgi:hypothetical protein